MKNLLLRENCSVKQHLLTLLPLFTLEREIGDKK